MSSVQEAVLNYLPGLAEVAVGENAATERKDLLVKAKTGTGKTIAFLVPAIENRFNELEAERKRFKDANPE